MRPTYLEVDLNQLKQNVAAIRAHVGGAQVMPMVKANAYGHGVDGVAPFIEPYVDYFGVAIVEEGIHLRSLGIKKPILVAGGTLIEQLPLFLEHDLTLTASSLDLLLLLTIWQSLPER
jgi:alanine racemase